VYYEFEPVRLALNVQNVFDDAYVASAFARNSTLVTFGAGRQVSAGLSVRF
jgi:iron complex outermembrane receptor protein